MLPAQCRNATGKAPKDDCRGVDSGVRDCETALAAFDARNHFGACCEALVQLDRPPVAADAGTVCCGRSEEGGWPRRQLQIAEIAQKQQVATSVAEEAQALASLADGADSHKATVFLAAPADAGERRENLRVCEDMLGAGRNNVGSGNLTFFGL